MMTPFTLTLTRRGIEKETIFCRRDASPAGPAKYEWSIRQGKNEIKLTHPQMMELFSTLEDTFYGADWT